MYYDLIASLPHLPHFSKADHLPITRLRLKQRLALLKPSHAEQLDRACPLVRWRPERLLGGSDREIVADFSTLMASPLEPPLREYVAFRMEQQTLLAALRRKREGLGLPEGDNAWRACPRFLYLRKHWDETDFHLAHLYRWLPEAKDRLAQGDAIGLERLLMDVAWRWLAQCAERRTFGFEAMFAFVFKWDILQAWLSCDAGRAKNRFTALIDKVTHVERN